MCYHTPRSLSATKIPSLLAKQEIYVQVRPSMKEKSLSTLKENVKEQWNIS